MPQFDLLQCWYACRIRTTALLRQRTQLGLHSCAVFLILAVFSNTGKGIYLASEHSKSAAYVRCGKLKGKAVGVMFLAEAALGKEHGIVRDDPSLLAPPKGELTLFKTARLGQHLHVLFPCPKTLPLSRQHGIVRDDPSLVPPPKSETLCMF